MPEIEITETQRDRLRAVQEALEADVVGKYGHVRPSDAVEYLLDRYEVDAAGTVPAAAAGDAGDRAAGDRAAGDATAAPDDGSDDGADAGDGDGSAAAATAAATGGDDDELDAVMNLLAEHENKWSESSSDARYEVELPDGTTEGARTKDDVRGLLFRHYR